MTLDDLPPNFLRAFALALGLLWGSFLNVVIHRVPRGMSIVRPASHCPACNAPIHAWQNIPLVSYLLMRGRARCCGAKVSLRYPLVEAMGGVVSIAILEAIVFRLDRYTPMSRALAIYGADFALALGLIAAAFIDLEFMILPDSITIGGIVLGVATGSFRELSLTDTILGAAVGFVVVWLPFIVIYPRVRRGRVGMGLGDAKLLALAGAWWGWQGALFVLGAGAIQGTIAAIATLLVKGRLDDPEAVKREREEMERELAAMTPEERAEVERELAADPLAHEAEGGVGASRIAFGPFLILASLEMLLVGRETIARFALGLSGG